MYDYDKEQKEICEKARTFDGAPTKKGDQCEELIRDKLQKHLDGFRCSVVLKGKVKDIKTEKGNLIKHDLLIVEVGTNSDEYGINDVLHLIEVKKGFIRADNGIKRYKKNKRKVLEKSPERNIKFSFLHLEHRSCKESFDDEREYFCLSDEKGNRMEGEWGDFVERIKDNIKSHPEM